LAKPVTIKPAPATARRSLKPPFEMKLPRRALASDNENRHGRSRLSQLTRRLTAGLLNRSAQVHWTGTLMARRTTQSSPGVAKPERIATVLEQEIRSGAIGYGERLQSESELVQRFSVSRNTVRKGLGELS